MHRNRVELALNYLLENNPPRLSDPLSASELALFPGAAALLGVGGAAPQAVAAAAGSGPL